MQAVQINEQEARGQKVDTLLKNKKQSISTNTLLLKLLLTSNMIWFALLGHETQTSHSRGKVNFNTLYSLRTSKNDVVPKSPSSQQWWLNCRSQAQAYTHAALSTRQCRGAKHMLVCQGETENKLHFTQDRESLKVTCSVTSVLWSKVMENDTVTNRIWHILLNCDQCEMIQNKRSSHAIIVFSWSIIAVASEFSCPHALTPIPNSQWFLMSGCWHTWPGFLSHLLFSRRCGTQGQNLD